MDYWQEIRKKSKEQWQELASEAWTETRIWVQEHGERAAAIALVSGIMIVLTYPLIAWVLVLGGGAAAAVWFMAPQGQLRPEASSPDDHEIH